MNKLKKIIVVCLLVALFANRYISTEASSDGTNMARVLKYYGKGNYKKASKSLKKGKIKSKTIGSRYVGDQGKYLKVNGCLKSHASYKNNKISMVYKDLK